MQRKRYGFWDALGDVGGFYDGCKLLIQLFMSTISAAFFSNQFENGSLEEAKPLDDYKKAKKANLARQVADNSQQAKLEGEKLGILTHVYHELQIVYDTLWHTLLGMFCRKRDKRRKFNYEKHLDIETIISNSLNLREFFRAFLSKR